MESFGSAFGWTTLKPLGLCSTIPPELVDKHLIVQRSVGLSKLPADAKVKRLVDKVPPKNPKKRPAGELAKASSRVWKTGAKRAMKQSEEYPPAFGKAVATMIREMFA